MSNFSEEICAIALCDTDTLNKIIRGDSQKLAISWTESSVWNIDKQTYSIKFRLTHMDRDTFIKRYILLYGSRKYYTIKLSLEKHHA